MSHSWPIIAIEGIDGSGKETQVKLLADYIRHVCKDIVDPVSQERVVVGKREAGHLGLGCGVLHRLDFASVNAWVAPWLFTLDRIKMADAIYEAQELGPVILNRWTLSNIAYSCAKLLPEKCCVEEAPTKSEIIELARTINEIEFGEFELPYPHQTFWLCMPPNKALELMRERGRVMDSYEKNLAFQYKVDHIYRYMYRANPSDVHMIECVDRDWENGRLKSAQRISDEITLNVDLSGEDWYPFYDTTIYREVTE